MPLPLALIAAWERRVCAPTTPAAVKIFLGGLLLAAHASLRFGDLQRIEVTNLSLAATALRGTCWTTKTTKQGQPFAVTITGFTGRDIATAWTIPTRPRFFLDLFAGIHSPLTQAAAALNLDRFTPFDIELDSRCDILDDDGFHAILRLCWSGLIGLACFAPPCKEFSRLKLRPGGPKALRTPQHMDGVPGLTTGEQQRAPRSIPGHSLFLAICHKGGIGVYEQPPSAMSWLLPAMQHMLKEVRAHIAWVDAGLEYAMGFHQQRP